MLTLIAEIKTKPGKEQEFAAAAKALAAEVTAREKGCLCYLPHTAADDPTLFVFVEKYNEPADLQAHQQTDHFKAFGRQTRDMLSGPPKLRMLKEL
ncbi:MAG TPA: putative quinol monooxygenase [Spirochaetia bacterium]|nr:putative quinol monooxygenase [Spirochaetia bacterium]